MNSAATVLEALKLFRTGLIGMDPLDIEGIHRMMDRLLSGNTSAKAAVDIALYDIKGKLMGQPLYKVLGGSVNQIVTDMTVGIDTPEAMAAEARERVEKDGFTILKIKAGKDKTYYIYNVCDHQECYREVGSQAISYTTGVPAMCGALMMLTGEWTKPGVYTVEEFNPDPFLDALDKYGLPRSENHDPVLVD